MLRRLIILLYFFSTYEYLAEENLQNKYNKISIRNYFCEYQNVYVVIEIMVKKVAAAVTVKYKYIQINLRNREEEKRN